MVLNKNRRSALDLDNQLDTELSISNKGGLVMLGYFRSTSHRVTL